MLLAPMWLKSVELPLLVPVQTRRNLFVGLLKVEMGDAGSGLGTEGLF